MFKNTIICSPKMYMILKDRGYNKEVQATIWCPADEWYYFSKVGKMRTVLKDGSIWTAIMDIDGWPSGYIRKLR